MPTFSTMTIYTGLKASLNMCFTDNLQVSNFSAVSFIFATPISKNDLFYLSLQQNFPLLPHTLYLQPPHDPIETAPVFSNRTDICITDNILYLFSSQTPMKSELNEKRQDTSSVQKSFSADSTK